MRGWIFQGNPDYSDVDTYLRNHSEIVWAVNQEGYADEMAPGDEVFIWRAAGHSRAEAGVVAGGHLTANPSTRRDDPNAVDLYTDPRPNTEAIRVPIRLWKVCTGPKEVVKRKWLKGDPVLSELQILKQPTGTNYPVTLTEAERLKDLVRNTNRDWTRLESLAGLWAYKETLNGPVSKLPGTPVARVGLLVGRAVSAAYNKVLNFRALDPRDPRKGLDANSETDRHVWAEFFDEATQTLKTAELDAEFNKLSKQGRSWPQEPRYKDFGPAPNDDPNELQQFAARVRKGQGKFRKGLLRLYDHRCSISGHGPPTALEAVHIRDHAATGMNDWDNGLLLRADLHHLFDAGLLEIDPRDLTVQMDPSLQGTPYWAFQGEPLRAREDGGRPSEEHLEGRWSGQAKP